MSSSPFIVEWIHRLAPGGDARRALDVAMGRGRHAVVLARSGFRTFGVDISIDAVRDASAKARADGLAIHAWCADLTQHPLPRARFDVVVVTRYLQRDLFPALRSVVVPGGVVLYETFTTAQRELGTGPTSPDHLLEPGELLGRFDTFEVLVYEEVVAPDAVARIAARRRIEAGRNHGSHEPSATVTARTPGVFLQRPRSPVYPGPAPSVVVSRSSLTKRS